MFLCLLPFGHSHWLWCSWCAYPLNLWLTSLIHHLTWKTDSLILVTSARRVPEICAFRSNSSYLVFHPEKLVLCPDVSLLIKVVSSFHLNLEVVLAAVFCNPSTHLERSLHTLNVKQVLAFCISRTLQFKKSVCLLCRLQKGHAHILPHFAHWITEFIYLACDLMHTQWLQGLKSHPSRPMASSAAALQVERWAGLLPKWWREGARVWKVGLVLRRHKPSSVTLQMTVQRTTVTPKESNIIPWNHG